MFSIMPTTRLRPSPYFNATVKEGVKSFAPYNSMLMPMGYGDPVAEYNRLMTGVSMWDVAVERQVQLKGRDAARLAQILSPRDLSACKIGQGKYIPMVNHQGTLINDPVLLKLAEDKFWFSIADSNILFWARAIASERNLDVEITEPDVSPLAIQGPMAENVTAALFGDWVRDLKYFWFKEAELDGMPVVVARSGWSKQGGFEIYLMDGSKGEALWSRVRAAGKPWGIAPGNPNPIERIESGLLSYGSDTDDATNPFEVRMGKYVDLDLPDDIIGVAALRQLKAKGIKRHQLGLILDGETPLPAAFHWFDITLDGETVGHMTNSTFSPRLSRNIGYALINRTIKPGQTVQVRRDEGIFNAALQKLPYF